MKQLIQSNERKMNRINKITDLKEKIRTVAIFETILSPNSFVENLDTVTVYIIMMLCLWFSSRTRLRSESEVKLWLLGM